MVRNARMLAVVLLLAGLGAAGCSTDDAEPGGAKDSAPTLSVRPTPSDSVATTASASTAATEARSATSSSAASAAPPSTTASKPVDLTQPPRTYAEAEAHLNAVLASRSAQQMEVFRTSDDIYCVLSHDVLDPACEAPQGGGTKDPKVCGDAESPQVGRIELAPRGAVPLCNTDTIRESMPAPLKAPAVLRSSASKVRCAVETIGVTCIDSATEAGFFLARGSYRVF